MIGFAHGTNFAKKFQKFFSPHGIDKENFPPKFEKILQVFVLLAQIEKNFTSFCPSGKIEGQKFSTPKNVPHGSSRGDAPPPVTKRVHGSSGGGGGGTFLR